MAAHDSKKARERQLLDEYLKFRHLSPQSVEPGERPDFVVTVSTADGVSAIGIELCEYQVDARPRRGAQSRALRAFHKRVSQRVEAQGFHRMRLNCWLSYDGADAPRHAQANGSADECMSFMRLKECDVPAFDEDAFGQSYERWKGDLDGFPVLKGNVQRVRLAGRAVQNMPVFWYNDTACTRLAVRAHVMRSLIRKHTVRKWAPRAGHLAEKWLIVCASVETAHDVIGPKLDDVSNSLDHLRKEARASGFDLVTFWESRAGWEHRIWDGKEAP